MLIAGAGGHALETFDLLCESQDVKSVVFFDDLTERKQLLGQFEVLKTADDAKRWFRKDPVFCLGVGAPESRRILAEKLIRCGGKLVGIHSRLAEISPFVKALDGTADFFKKTFVGSQVEVGYGSLINTGAQIHHESVIGCFCEVGPVSLLLGKATIGKNCRIGAGAVILPKIHICDEVTIAAGSVVTKDICDAGIYMGIPARRSE